MRPSRRFLSSWRPQFFSFYRRELGTIHLSFARLSQSIGAPVSLMLAVFVDGDRCLTNYTRLRKPPDLIDRPFLETISCHRLGRLANPYYPAFVAGSRHCYLTFGSWLSKF